MSDTRHPDRGRRWTRRKWSERAGRTLPKGAPRHCEDSRILVGEKPRRSVEMYRPRSDARSFQNTSTLATMIVRHDEYEKCIPDDRRHSRGLNRDQPARRRLRLELGWVFKTLFRVWLGGRSSFQRMMTAQQESNESNVGTNKRKAGICPPTTHC